ncbi:ragulator complex protein LAMTOR4 homolog [Eupeodes corollae]|uniref:ragulator complex protein LAMTOR4 homolog n=1 Tax=Eupeodes corollae TaxID=290404 RepID=UPI0024909E40|nr:ragulator complex protein LAMTOR4 homolog [Eupeodes corollae]
MSSESDICTKNFCPSIYCLFLSIENMEKIGNQIGYLILKDDGAVLESGGDLENDERSANIFMGILQMSETIDENFMAKSSCEKISIIYEDHSYTMCMSNRKIYVIKQKHTTSSSGFSDLSADVGNSIIA